MPAAPRYPVYIVRAGASWRRSTARALDRSRVPYRVVIDFGEWAEAVACLGASRLLQAPEIDETQGRLQAADRAWEHAASEGAPRHWVLGDGLRGFRARDRAGRRWKPVRASAFLLTLERSASHRRAALTRPGLGSGPCRLVETYIPFCRRPVADPERDLERRLRASGRRVARLPGFRASGAAAHS